MSDRTIDKVLKAVDEFRNRRSEIDRSLNESTEFRDILKQREKEVLVSKVRDILRPEYNLKIQGITNEEGKLHTLRDTKEALTKQFADRLDSKSDEFQACEEGSSTAARDVYNQRSSQRAWVSVPFFDWVKAFLSLGPNDSRWRRLGDFVLIGLGGLLGGWLNFLQADSPQVFDTSYWPQALMFGLCAAWVGVFVVLGTDNPDYLRRFAIGIVCGFAGAVVLNTAEKTVGIASEQVPLTKNAQIEAQLKVVLDEAAKEGAVFERDVLDTAVDNGSQEIKIGQFEHTIITVVGVVSALRSPDANSEGYSIAVNLLNAIERWGETYPDTALESLDHIRKQPRISTALIHLIDAHTRRLRTLQRQLPQGDALPTSAIPTVNLEFSSPQALGFADESVSHADNAQLDSSWPKPEYKESLILVSNDGAPLLADEMPAGVQQSPLPTYPIIGYVRLANRDKDATQWTDILFAFENGGIAATLSGLLPTRAAQIKEELKGKYLVANTDTYVRATFPVLSERGLIFSKQTGILHKGDIVQVVDAQAFTTQKIGFSQIWLSVTPVTRIHIETASGQLDQAQSTLESELKKIFGEKRVDRNGSATNTIISPDIKYHPADQANADKILQEMVKAGLPTPSPSPVPDPQQTPGNIQLLLP